MHEAAPPARVASSQSRVMVLQAQALAVLSRQRNALYRQLINVDDFVDDCLRHERARRHGPVAPQQLAALEAQSAQLFQAWHHLTAADRLLYRRRSTKPELAQLRWLLAQCDSVLASVELAMNMPRRERDSL